jgi:DNA primase
MSNRLVELYVENGFCDADCIEFADIVIKDCIARLRAEGELAKIQLDPNSTVRFADMNHAANIIRDHFYRTA